VFEKLKTIFLSSLPFSALSGSNVKSLVAHPGVANTQFLGTFGERKTKKFQKVLKNQRCPCSESFFVTLHTLPAADS
jgi:hypothetical protein